MSFAKTPADRFADAMILSRYSRCLVSLHNPIIQQNSAREAAHPKCMVGNCLPQRLKTDGDAEQDQRSGEIKKLRIAGRK